MKIKCYKPLSNWLSWVVLILMMAISPIIQAATDCNAVTEISKGECESLLELYNSTDGANWTNNTGWNVTNTPCSWHGVSCSNGGVTRISLINNELKGSIPDFSSLPKLEKLSLYTNQLSGSIPDFSALPNLKHLKLDNNKVCKDKNTNYGKFEIQLNAFSDCPTSEPQTHTLSTSSGNGGSISRFPEQIFLSYAQII